MSISGQSGVGKIELFDDFAGEDLAVGNTSAATVPGMGIGPFKITGKVAETDSGIVLVSKANGYVRLTGTNEDGEGVAIGSNVVWSPELNGTLVLETRLELPALTARNVFAGFCTANAAQVQEPLTAATATITKVVPSVGFLFDSQLTSKAWHMPYLLAGDTDQASTTVVSEQSPVAAESDILRVEIDNNGAARWFINGVLVQSIGAGLAATPATLLAGLVGVWGTTTTVTTLDVDYLLIRANRDWTR